MKNHPRGSKSRHSVSDKPTETCCALGADAVSHLCLHQLGDVGLPPNVIFDAIQSTFQGSTSHQQDEQDDIGEERGEVDNLQKTGQGHVRSEGMHVPLCRRNGQVLG